MVVWTLAPWKSNVPKALVGNSSVLSCIRHTWGSSGSSTSIFLYELAFFDCCLEILRCSANKRPQPHLKKCYFAHNLLLFLFVNQINLLVVIWFDVTYTFSPKKWLHNPFFERAPRVLWTKIEYTKLTKICNAQNWPLPQQNPESACRTPLLWSWIVKTFT